MIQDLAGLLNETPIYYFEIPGKESIMKYIAGKGGVKTGHQLMFVDEERTIVSPLIPGTPLSRYAGIAINDASEGETVKLGDERHDDAG